MYSGYYDHDNLDWKIQEYNKQLERYSDEKLKEEIDNINDSIENNKLYIKQTKEKIESIKKQYII
jgi:hypothetical protein